MPMMYLILLANTWALAATHLSIAPAWLTIAVPAVFTLICAIRINHWLRSRGEPSPEAALRELNRTNRLAFVIPIVFTTWSFLLYPYGNAYSQSHIAFYMAITVIACIFCLMHLRSAAFAVTAIVNGAFVAFFMSTGQPTFIAIAINIVLVCIAMLTILVINHQTFARMIDAQDQTLALSNENLRLANLDSLTDLPNRRAFFAQLDEALESARANNTRLAVGVIDLDGFKPVNDLYGHSTGDRLLVAVGKRLASLFGGDDMFLSRLGGDEFAFLMSNAPDDQAVVARGDEICAALHAQFELPDATVLISGSVGISIFPELASTAEQLFDNADYALYHGKRAKRGSSTLFTATHHAQIHRDARIEQTLRQASLDNELSVVFQPIVDMRTGLPLGFEALARWNSPVLGRVSPAHFIPVAERAGIIGALSRALLKKALSAASAWPDDLRLSFNLSAHDLNAADSTIAVMSIIQKSGFDAARIDLEITETAFAHDFEQVRSSTDMLRLMGCGISLDDFGTGYSSLTQLHALPLTKIKIDRSFVTRLHQRPASRKIVRSLLALGKDMGLDCVIEGIESEEEKRALDELGGAIAQGHYYSAAVPASEVPGYLASVRPVTSLASAG
ncbi:EAL domain-containing protein [uncultured Hyphomicrobium sp.]|uniref:putative bifunctional diguanylate cyclase/phosphodiesterase n=1 Tax=uncultured Hyphomicrobium sp. TaxID=194373 RepID=UPI0025F3E59F|nr:EAL domain-containing protein [uncultured Hyphomicrobium sp.]